MHVQLCMQLTKFQVHVHIQFMLVGLPRVPVWYRVTRVIFLLPDGYPASEYLICRDGPGDPRVMGHSE